MVRITFSTLLATLLITTSAGCGFIRKNWGEKAPPRKTVSVQSETLPDFLDVFNDDEQVAITTLDRYERFILNSFDQIEGKQKNHLSVEEIITLGKAGLAKFSNDQELSLKRIRSILTILGYRNGITREEVRELIEWARTNRIKAKSFYRILINYRNEEFNSAKLMDILRFTGSLVRLGGNGKLGEKELNEVIQPWIPEQFEHAKRALPDGIHLLNGIFASLCGDRIDAGFWNALKNGGCLIELTDHFEATAPVFDLIFNHLNPVKQKNELQHANSVLVSKMESWINGHQHPSFRTGLISELATTLEIPAPYHFFQLTEWIPKLDSFSTAEEFNPRFFIRLSNVVESWVSAFLHALETSEGKSFCTKSDWSKCGFEGTFEPADLLFNEDYATVIRVRDYGFIYEISLYDAISGFLLESLDRDQNGILKEDITDLITIIVRLLDSNAFAQNVINRLLEKPVTIQNTEASINKQKRHGLAEVAALASDLIPKRGGSQRSILRQIGSQVYDSEKSHTYALDRLGITTFIHIYHLLMELRDQALKTYDFQPEKTGTTDWIQRKRILELLPRMLKAQFPRIYEECMKQGFERTCGVIYSEVLASPEKGSTVLEPLEIDSMNLTSVLLESMMGRCDRDGNGELSASLLDGFDEKDCILTVSRTLVTRLMNANILEEETKTRVLLKVLKWAPPVKWAAKVALQRGTLKGISWRAAPPFSILSRPASLGSVMSLVAEFMDPAKTEAIDAGIDGPQIDPGDELIYRGRMTCGLNPRDGALACENKRN